MTQTEIYWILQMDAIQGTAMLIGLLFGIGSFSGIALSIAYSVLERDGYVWLLVFPFTLILALSFLTCLIPSTKTLAAVYLIPKIAESKGFETFSKDSQAIYKLAMERVKDILEPKLDKAEE